MNNLLMSKVKFIRSIKGFPFYRKIDESGKQSIKELLTKECEDLGLKVYDVESQSAEYINELVDKFKLDEEFAWDGANMMYANGDNGVCVEVNGKEHVQIVGFGLDFDTPYINAKEIDKKLCDKIEFLYSDKYGFLNGDIKNIGAGFQIYNLVMLPALTKTGKIKNLPIYKDKLRFEITKLDEVYGVYLICTTASLGLSEKDVFELNKSYIDNVVAVEKSICESLMQDELEVQDALYRAKGILSSCVKIAPYELTKLLGDIYIGINAGIENNVTHEDIVKMLGLIKRVELDDKEKNILAKNIKQIINK